MKSEIVVRRADPEEFERVGALAYELLIEIDPDSRYQRNEFVDTARKLLSGGNGVWAFWAKAPGDREVGVVTLNECAAIYAGGRFGEIPELYVVPDFRSKSVGTLLIEAVVAFGRERGWPDIEVGAPSVPTWQRTVDFYLRHEFEEIGPRLDLALGEAD